MPCSCFLVWWDDSWSLPQLLNKSLQMGCECSLQQFWLAFNLHLRIHLRSYVLNVGWQQLQHLYALQKWSKVLWYVTDDDLYGQWLKVKRTIGAVNHKDGWRCRRELQGWWIIRMSVIEEQRTMGSHNWDLPRTRGQGVEKWGLLNVEGSEQ